MYLKRSSGKDWSGDELTTALRSISRLAHHGLVETGEDVSGVVFNKEDFEKLNLDEIASKVLVSLLFRCKTSCVDRVIQYFLKNC